MRSKGWAFVALLVIAGLVLSGCGPTPEPQVVEKVVTEVVEVEKEVTRMVEGTPVVETVVEERVVEVQVTATPEPVVEGPRHGGTLTIVIPEEVKGLNNHADSGTEGEWPLNQITEGLVERDIDRNIIPGLAESWEVSEDGLTYTFYLREGVKFHDGTDFDAEDVKWTMDQVIIPDSYSGGKWAPYIEGTEIIDDYTVAITLKGPWYDFINLLAFEEDLDILSREAVEAAGEDYGYVSAVGTGPFKFDYWNRGEELVLVRNDEWWNSGDENLPYLDKIVYRAVKEDSVKLIQLATKNVDLIFNVPFNDVSALKTDPDITVQSMAGGTIHFLAFIHDWEPFDDLRIRQAITHAIDKQAIVDTIFAGQATVANGIFPPTLFVSKNDTVTYEYDPQKAMDLLASAGYGPDNPLKFLILTSNATLYSDEAVLIQAQLKEVGVEAEILPLEKAALSTYTTGSAPDAEEKRQSVLYRYGYTGTFINDYTFRSFYSDGSLNRYAYNNPEVDELILAAYQEHNPEKLLEANQAVNDALVADCPWVFIAFQNNIFAHQNYVKGLNAWPMNTIPMQGIWLEK
jgi:peptide/nickel transport system substrate-binding protein